MFWNLFRSRKPSDSSPSKEAKSFIVIHVSEFSNCDIDSKVKPSYQKGEEDKALSLGLKYAFSNNLCVGDYMVFGTESGAMGYVKKYHDFTAGHFYLVCRMDLTIPEIKEQLSSGSGFSFHDHLITIEESREFSQHASSKPNQTSRAS